MNIVLEEITIRDFKRSDATAPHTIVRERDTNRFMRDWADNAPAPEDFYSYIDWLQTKKGSCDVYENKRYAVTLNETGELVGMVGFGLEQTLGEVELTYFISERFCRRGFCAESGYSYCRVVLFRVAAALSYFNYRLRERAVVCRRCGVRRGSF